MREPTDNPVQWRRSMNWKTWLFDPSAPKAVLLVRLLVGIVFLSEGIQKFLYPATLGVGRFAKIGIPVPQYSAPFVGSVESVCGALVVVGFLTRLAAIPLLATISVALATTKVPMLIRSGFWAAMHEARTDICMFLGTIFLISVGAGPLSIDAKLAEGNSDHTKTNETLAVNALKNRTDR